ncbi:MAG: 4Fe-4S dicluster domain-containing protein [Desulfobacterium sp.]|nr:4Fe-4S dicluster domain-containing protein [Desulfobacterium sp.]MBU3950479.1 4Fe-4S binding protein [Pseudomonadota bacterium]MBU4036684.1 4Fe-4S binding protein [Pseudomonadota bacterium]
MTIVIDKTVCVGCGFCNLLCQEYALKVSKFFVTELDQDRCIECLLCLNYCPIDAIGENQESR